MAHHELFGKVLASLKGGTGFRRSDNEDIRTLEIVVYAVDKRIFIAYYNHFHTLFSDKALYGVEVQGRHVDILPVV